MTTFAWLIEAPGPMYLRPRVIANVYDFSWTDDPNKALRFFNQEQADATMMALRQGEPELFAFARTLRDPRVLEHGFVESLQPENT